MMIVIKEWVWILIMCIGIGLFLMLFGFAITNLLLLAAAGFIAVKTFQALREKDS